MENNDKELREKFSKVLGAPYTTRSMYDSTSSRATYSWEEIFNEIGKLQERATFRESDLIRRETEPYPYKDEPSQKQPPHYHNGSPCYNNPCITCGTSYTK